MARGMKLATFAELCSQIESTSSQNDMQDVVAGVLRDEDPEDAERFVRFLTGQRYDDPDRKTGVGGTTVRKAAASAFGIGRDTVDSFKDELGKSSLAVGKAYEERTTDMSPSGLTLADVEEMVQELPDTSGNTAKQEILEEHLLACQSADEAKWLSYCVLGSLSLGCGTGIVRKAISEVYGVSRDEIDHGYALLGTTPQVVRQLSEEGALPENPVPHKPFKVMKGGNKDVKDVPDHFVAQPKYDGARVLVHSDGEEIRVYSTNRKDVTESLPEITDALEPAFPFIIDGEAVAYDPKTDEMLGFEPINQRFRRKHNIEEMREEEVEVRTWFFDCQLVGDVPSWSRPFTERVDHLRQVVEEVTDVSPEERKWDGVTYEDFGLVKVSPTSGDVGEMYNTALSRGHEGIMSKDPESVYEFGSRPSTWYKTKPVGEVDLRVTKVATGNGENANKLGRLYLETADGVGVGRVGIGFGDEFRERHAPKDGEYDDPEGHELVGEIIEVTADELQTSKSGSRKLRFPRFERMRPEGTPDSLDRVENVLN